MFRIFLVLSLVFCTVLRLQGQKLLDFDSLSALRTYYLIDKALENPEQVYRLFSDEFHYTPNEVYEALPKLPNLQSLQLSGALFMELPKEILALNNQLQEFIISDNDYVLWDKVFGQLQGFSRLSHLRLELNPEQLLSPSICQLDALKRLSINKGSIDSLPDCLCEMKQLEVLDLRSSGLRKLPNDIHKLKRLEVLLLGPFSEDAWPLSLDPLPENLGKCKRLRVLDLQQTGLRKLPPSFKSLKLEKLLLSGNRLDKTVFTLLPKLSELRHIELAYCNLKKLPEELLECKKLEYLDLRGCPLERFPLKREAWPKLDELKLPAAQFTDKEKENLRKHYARTRLYFE